MPRQDYRHQELDGRQGQALWLEQQTFG